jgi:hypothetical protein
MGADFLCGLAGATIVCEGLQPVESGVEHRGRTAVGVVDERRLPDPRRKHEVPAVAERLGEGVEAKTSRQKGE